MMMPTVTAGVRSVGFSSLYGITRERYLQPAFLAFFPGDPVQRRESHRSDTRRHRRHHHRERGRVVAGSGRWREPRAAGALGVRAWPDPRGGAALGTVWNGGAAGPGHALPHHGAA